MDDDAPEVRLREQMRAEETVGDEAGDDQAPDEVAAGGHSCLERRGRSAIPKLYASGPGRARRAGSPPRHQTRPR